MPSHLVASCLLLALGLNMSLGAIHKRSGANSLGGDPNPHPSPEGRPVASPAASVENTDLLDKLSWKCANNASCLYGVANGIMASYRRGETLKLGLFDLVKLPELDASRKHKWGSGRGLSSFMDFVTGNAIRVPVGPMVFSVQRAEDDSEYIEVALLKKASSGTGNDGRPQFQSADDMCLTTRRCHLSPPKRLSQLLLLGMRLAFGRYPTVIPLTRPRQMPALGK